MPQQFGPYTLHDLIARGGMAEVYRATMPGIGGFEKTVAIKKILPHLAENDEFITMLINEARIIVSLNHANIAQVYDLGRLDDTYYIAMEYVHGVDLSQVLKAQLKVGETMPISHALYITSAVCAGLHVAHNKVDEQGRPLNIVHRDISPHNVLISYAGDVKIIDFGVAKARGKENNTKMGVIKGKLLYMAPEQAMARPIDGRADLFAAGLILYSMLTGELPFEGDNEFQIYNHIISKEIVAPKLLNPQIPDEVNAILMTLLERDPDRRYQDGYGVKIDLDRALHNLAPGYSVNRLSRFLEENFGGGAAGDETAERTVGRPSDKTADKTAEKTAETSPRTASLTATAPGGGPAGVSVPGEARGSWPEIDEMEDTVNLSMDSAAARQILEQYGRIRAWEDNPPDQPAPLQQPSHNGEAREHEEVQADGSSEDLGEPAPAGPAEDEALSEREPEGPVALSDAPGPKLPLAPLGGITILVIFILAMLAFGRGEESGPGPVAEEPVAEEPAAEEPVAEEPVAEEPVAEEPVAEEPVAEEPVDPESTPGADGLDP